MRVDQSVRWRIHSAAPRESKSPQARTAWPANARMSTAYLHTSHRPPREWPPPVPTDRLRIAAPPTVPTPASHSLLTALMPMVGGVGLFGFALINGSSAFLVIVAALM